MNQRNGFRKLIAAILLLASAPTAHAAGSSQFGILYGYSVPDADNTNAFKVTGVQGVAFLAPVFSIGGYYLVSDRSGQKDTTDQFAYSLHGVESAFHIPAANGDTFVALRIGLSKVHQSPGGTDMIFSPYHYGIATGYDFFVSTYLSLGFEGSYIHVLPGRTILKTVEYDQPSFNIMNFFIAVKLRL